MKKITPKYDRNNNGHYSPGVISNGMLYISGQLSIDPDTGLVPEGGIDEHASQAFANMDRVLKAAGVGRDKVVQCRIYISDIENWDEVNRIAAEYFGEHKPARIVVPTAALHFGCKIEIEAIAEASDQ